ncbi:MAG: hypothetical protein KatS3mg087_0021 [Patescibacteria group bacterium]|nr:MAG: hypothetical protein KatS3mg087_0021 [Patescibacteria group bacterium]
MQTTSDLKNYPETIIRPLTAIWRKVRNRDSISRDDAIELVRKHFSLKFVPNLDVFRAFTTVDSISDSSEGLIVPILLSVSNHLYNTYRKPITLVKILEISLNQRGSGAVPILNCRALPVLSPVSPGLGFDFNLPMPAYLRFLTVCKSKNFGIKNLLHTWGLYCYLGSNKGSFVKWVSTTKELRDINMKILSCRFGRNSSGKSFQCRFCKRIHKTLDESCPLSRRQLLLPEVLDELVVLIRR